MHNIIHRTKRFHWNFNGSQNVLKYSGWHFSVTRQPILKALPIPINNKPHRNYLEVKGENVCDQACMVSSVIILHQWSFVYSIHYSAFKFSKPAEQTITDLLLDPFLINFQKTSQTLIVLESIRCIFRYWMRAVHLCQQQRFNLHTNVFNYSPWGNRYLLT